MHVLEICKLIIFGYIMYNYIERVDCSDDRDSEYFFSFRASRRNILSKQQVSNENVKLFYVYVIKVKMLHKFFFYKIQTRIICFYRFIIVFHCIVSVHHYVSRIVVYFVYTEFYWTIMKMPCTLSQFNMMRCVFHL